VRLNN